MAPPIDFGIRWHIAGIHRRYGMERELWLCPDAPPAFSDAYRGARAAMIAAGYSWTSIGSEHGVLTPCWWDGASAVDVDALRTEVDRVVAEAASARAERARIEEERIAAETARLAPLAAPIRAELAEIVPGHPRMLGRHLTAARELLALEEWTIYGIQDAERYVSNGKGNAERAAERLGRTPPRIWFEKAADAETRAVALRACRYLSSLDEDWAAIRNASGGSQVTTWTGHLLSEKATLDQGEAGQALALLHGHQRQLPNELSITLFGEGLRPPATPRGYRRPDPRPLTFTPPRFNPLDGGPQRGAAPQARGRSNVR